MGFINLAEKTISAKLVYYGVGMGGKTTSLKAVHEIMCPTNEVQLVSINTEEDSTLLFDFLPMDLGSIEGFKIRIQGFTVPGQPKYRRMRKYVLSGADAVVMVIDSESSRLEENLQSMESLKENLRANGLDPTTIPIVLQYNKRDLDDVLPEAELDRHFRERDDILAFPSVGTEAAGVFEAFVHAAGLLVADKVRLYGLGRGQVDPEALAEASRQRLWDMADKQRMSPVPSDPQTLRLRFDEEGNATDSSDDAAKPGRAAALEAATAVQSADELAAAEPQGEASGAGASTVLDDLPVLTAEDLEIDLDFAEIEQEPETTGTRSIDDEDEMGLLDVSVESNLQIAERLGELDSYATRLERKNRELVQTSQNVVHDLRRPLSAIKLMLSSMRSGLLGEIETRTQTAVDTGLAATKQMERLIQDLIDSSRLDFDGVQMNFEEVDLTVLASEVVHGLRWEIEEVGVGVRIEPMPVIKADAWALQKALTNLVGNAIQYGDAEQPRIWISATDDPDNDRWILTIRDNGIGIPEKDLSRMFERFERGTNTSGISGTGLGLHIVKEVMLGHGGGIWVESSVGQGTTFHLALPKSPVQPPHSTVSDV